MLDNAFIAILILALAQVLFSALSKKQNTTIKNEAEYKQKIRELELDYKKIQTGLRKSEKRYDVLYAELVKERCKTRSLTVANENTPSLKTKRQPENHKKVNTLKVERDVKPSTSPKSIKLSKSTLNALLVSGKKEVSCQTN